MPIDLMVRPTGRYPSQPRSRWTTASCSTFYAVKLDGGGLYEFAESSRPKPPFKVASLP